MQPKGTNIVASVDSAEGGSVFRAHDPALNLDIDPPFHEATQREIGAAADAALESFKAFRSIQPETKGAFLESIAEDIISLGDVLIQRCNAETGLPRERLEAERLRTTNQLRMFAQLVREGSWVDARIDTSDPERKPLPKPDVRSMQLPLGPVAVFGASNFPLAFSVAGGDTASAFAAGCTVVVKAHPAHPGTCELVGRAILRAADRCGLPGGVFSMVHGVSHEVGMSLVRHPSMKAVGFTGSFRGGMVLHDLARTRKEPIPVFAEMGSTNPVFILPGAVRERSDVIARDLSASITIGVGQFCTKPGLVFVAHANDAQNVVDHLAERLSGISSGVMLTPAIREGFHKGVSVRTRIDGVHQRTQGRTEAPGVFGTPTLLTAGVGTFLDNPLLQEEVFGPTALALMAGNKEELLKAASALHGHLTATIHGTARDLEDYGELVRILENKVGRLIINGYPTGVEVGHAMVHGGPYPATTDPRSTSVGTAAVFRFTRPVCYQGFPQTLLPDELKDANPRRIWRTVNGERTNQRIGS